CRSAANAKPPKHSAGMDATRSGTAAPPDPAPEAPPPEAPPEASARETTRPPTAPFPPGTPLPSSPGRSSRRRRKRSRRSGESRSGVPYGGGVRVDRQGSSGRTRRKKRRRRSRIRRVVRWSLLGFGIVIVIGGALVADAYYRTYRIYQGMKAIQPTLVSARN